MSDNDILRMLRANDARLSLTEVKEVPRTAYGSANPSSWPIGVPFFRTDYLLPVFYDGTQWLTQFYMHATNGSPIVVNATQANLITPIRQDVAPYIDRVAIELIVQTTNNAGNRYDIDIRGVSANYGAASIITSLSTGSIAVNTWVASDGIPNVTSLPANRAFFDFNFTKVGAPGALSIMATLYYRLVIP